jgi:hypothetical protein
MTAQKAINEEGKSILPFAPLVPSWLNKNAGLLWEV